MRKKIKKKELTLTQKLALKKMLIDLKLLNEAIFQFCAAFPSCDDCCLCRKNQCPSSLWIAFGKGLAKIKDNLCEVWTS